MVTDTVCVALHPVALVMVIVPEYGPPATVPAVMAIPVKDPPPEAKTKVVFPWSESPAVWAALFQAILYVLGELVVAE